MLPLLFAYSAKLKLNSISGERILDIEDFILGYRQTALRNNELITGVIIPKPVAGSQLLAYKVSKRKDLDISTVCASFNLRLDKGSVAALVIAYGGMAATTRRASSTEKFLTGKEWTRPNVEEAMKILSAEFEPISDARSEAEFRSTAARNLLLKFYSETTTN